MATFEEHCRDCERQLGSRFERVHTWLDELQAEYGPMHRVFRHNIRGIDMVRAQWGDQAAKAAEIHIRRDCNGKLLTPEEYRDYYGINTEHIIKENEDR
jgi:hypothetical protein